MANHESEVANPDLNFTIRAMQQQFERMNLVFGEIRDRMDRQDAAIADLRREPPMRAQNGRRHVRRVASPPVHEFDDEVSDDVEDEEEQVAYDGSRYMARGGRQERRA